MRAYKDSSTLAVVEPEQSLSLYDLQSNLLKVWTQKRVDKYYQKAMLAYMDSLPEGAAKQEIIREHERMLEHRSLFSRIKECMELREAVLENLEVVLQDEAYIEQACDDVDQLRKLNLKLCESILEIKETLESKGVNGGVISQGYN
jgi:hypothetical protein